MGAIEPDELPFNLQDEIGIVTAAAQLFLGVYHLRTEPNSASIEEYYVVTKDSALFPKASGCIPCGTVPAAGTS